MKGKPLLFVAVLATLVPEASWATTCGCAPYAAWPDTASALPLNPVLIVRYCSARDPDYEPYLSGPRGRIRLKGVEVPGLGPRHRAFAPRKGLEPHQRYELRFGKTELRARFQASWTTDEEPDSLPPVWRAPPTVEYAGSSRDFHWENSELFVRIPASDDRGALAVLVELTAPAATTTTVLTPQAGFQTVTVPAEPLDPMLVLESQDCSQFKFRSGTVFEARLSVIDASGHVTPSPAGALRFRIPDPRSLPSYEVRTVLPRWPAVVSKPEPPFPALARKARIQGVVKGELSIGPAGQVEEVTIVEGLPLGLAEATVGALEGWLFAPARDGASRRTVRFQTHFMVIQPEYHPDWNP